MFSLFKKKEMDRLAAEHFWHWFAEKESWIVETHKTNGMAVVWAVDEQLKPIFPYFKKELEFQLGYNDGKGEFFFFHLGNKNLIHDSATLEAMMPADLRQRWSFITEE